MSVISNALSYIGHLAVQVISSLGYFGVFFLMMLESMIFPIPSELVMPFAGFLAARGTFNFWLVVFFSAFGSLVGSLLSYYIGYYGGKGVVKKFGKYAFLDEHDLDKTHNWFNKKGPRTIFVSRFVPVVRHLISIPAGIGKMDLKKFCIFTVIGATMWNTFLAYLGYVLGSNWESVKKYSEYISIPVAIIVVIVCIFFVHRHFRNKKRKQG